MALSYRATPAVSQSSGAVSSLAITKQAGTAAGDVILIYAFGAAVATTPSIPGFTASALDSNDIGLLFSRTADGTEGATFTISGGGGSQQITAGIATVAGSTGTITSVTPSTTTASASASFPVTGITMPSAGWVVGFFGNENGFGSNGYAVTAPSGYTSRATNGAQAANATMMVADNESAPSGATGTITATCTTASFWSGVLVGLVPASGGVSGAAALSATGSLSAAGSGGGTSLTVTAAQSGANAANGIALTVKVVTGQAASPVGATGANDSTITTPQLAITPAATGSWVYGSLFNGAADTAYTANAGTTLSANIPDTTNFIAYGTCRSTSGTTASAPVTIGASAPTEGAAFLAVALVEIKAGTTLAEDASSPAGVHTFTAETVATASFTPPAGSLLVAMVSSFGTGGGVVALAVSDSSGLTWTRQAQSPTFGDAAVFTAPVPGGASGAAALAGAGAMTAAGTATSGPTAGMTAAGTLAAAAAETLQQSAALAGSGSLSAAAAVRTAGAASLPAAGSLSAAAGSAVTVPASWSGSAAAVSGYTFPLPAARPVQVAVANTAGHWMIAIVTWRQAAGGAGVTVSVADDVHNWWEPLGAPAGDSAAAGVTRCAVWAAPAARAAAYVQAAPSGPCQALAVRILDVNGMQPWMTMTPVVTNYALAATSLPLSAPAPSASAFLVACAGSDNNADTIGGPGAGWTPLASVTAGNGVDHTADITLSAAWRVTSGAASAAWTSTGALDFSGVIAGVLVSGAAPATPNPNWPVLITEIAPGSGAQTPPALLAWTPLSARALSLNVQQGRQYTLSQLMAGQGAVVIDNPDGALIPPGTGAFAGIDSGTPIRQRAYIPSSPAPNCVPFSGYLQRWPFAVPGDMLRGETQATLTDAWGYAAGMLNSMAREEMLIDSPYALWPLDDPAGSQQGSNIAPGNSSPLTLTLSKYGAAGATAAFGANSGAIIGDTSAEISGAEGSGESGGAEGMFSQTLAGTSLNTNNYGYALVCADGNYPPVSGGVTIEAWFGNTTSSGLFGFTAATSGSLFGSAGGFAAGQPVVLSAAAGFTLPGGFTAGTPYYVVGVSGTAYQLSATVGGAAITVTAAGAGFIQTAVPWSPVVIAARNLKGSVAQIQIRDTDGALVIGYTTASGSVGSAVVDGTSDYRQDLGLRHVSLAFNQTSWRVIIDGGAFGGASGTFSSPLPPSFAELDFGGVQDRATQGYAFSGYVALAAVYPAVLSPERVLSHFWAAGAGMASEAASDRVERIIEYAGLAGRRWLGQQAGTGEGDLMVSGQDIGGQGAATSISNVAASTVPAIVYVAPTGDIVYWSKQFTWNQPVRWTLGDNAAGGEIPFLPAQFSTDYDNARVVNDIQLTQLDTQTVTVPSGVMASTTVAAIEAASSQQYGDQPLQQTGYLNFDATSPYDAGGSMIDLANWMADVYARPRNRVQAVTVNAAANAANVSSSLAWQFWASASVGDMVAVNVRLPTAAASPLISLVARITQTQRTGQFSQDGTSATITCVLDFAPEYNALICDDPIRGLLDGSCVLSW